MVDVWKKKFPNQKNQCPIRISKSRERERFHEYLVTQEEIPYCHEIDGMYRIALEKNKKNISPKQFSSETAPRISREQLHTIINELLSEYQSYY